MTKLILAAGIALALATPAAAAPAATAGIPDPSQSVFPAYIDLVGCRAGAVDPAGTFTVTVKDPGNNPVPGCNVKVVFASDLKIYAASPGATVDCAGRSVTTKSDANGIATFDIAGATINSNGVVAGSGANGATIHVCEIVLGQATVAVFDENGALGTLGVAPNDLAGWLGDFSKQGTIGYKGRSDFSHDGKIASNDLAVWLKRFGSHASTDGCGTLCP